MLYREPVANFLDRVRSDQVCLGAQHSIMSPQVVEMYGWAGLDFVVIGTEVEAVDRSMIENLMRAANASNIVPIVKLAHPDPRLVTETLNWGAPLVLCPHVTSAKVLDELVAAARFFPIGTRGECPVARYTKYGLTPLDQSREWTNTATSVIPIIEDREALDNIEEIMANEHIAMIEIGPFDFARSLEAKHRGPVVMEAIDKVVTTARAYGKKVMMPMWITPETDSSRKIIDHQIDKLISRGITVLFQPDIHVLSDHYRNLMPLRGIRVRQEPEEPEGVEELDEAAMMLAAAAPPEPDAPNGKSNGKSNGKASKSASKAKAPKAAKAAPKATPKAKAKAKPKTPAKAAASRR